MFSPCVKEKPSAASIDSEHFLEDMTSLAKLILETADEDAKEVYQDDKNGATLFDRVVADHPMEFEWYDEHSLLPDGGWEMNHNEEEMSPIACNSETEFDYV